MAFPTPLESGGLPSWALAITLSAVFISLLWFAALAVLIVHEVRHRHSYRWVPTTPSPPPPKRPSPSREPSFLSGHPPPPISPHPSTSSLDSTPSATGHTSSFGHINEKKKDLLPSYNEAAIDVPCLDPFEETEEKEYSLRLHRGSSFISMASSASGESPAAEKKVPEAVSYSKQQPQGEATPTSPSPFTRLGSPDSSRSSGRSSDSSALAGMVLSRPVTLRQLGATIREPGYLEGEFRKLPNPVYTAEDMPRGTERKNRYSNVLPTPKTRVHLPLLLGRPNSDYINANFIRGYQGSPRQYIATQAPMESTVEEFWRMVWENNTDTIVMATNFTERGIDKCCRYWPAQGCEGYGSLEVTLLHQTMTDTYSEATLSLRSLAGGEVRTVRHYRLTCWPTQGVPKETKTITGFLRVVKMADSRGPVVVHCSAGVGRTGVLLALDIGLQGLLQGHSKMDVLRVVSTLRQDRSGCVQTREQYRFIHQALYDVAKELGPQKGVRSVS